MNMKKKILALIMLAMLAACMAIPAFATEYCFTPINQSNVYLNLVGSPGSNMYMRRLSLYRTSVLGEDQRFTRRTINVGGQEATYWMKDNQYAINKSNGSYLEGYVAFMWPVNYAAQEINNDSLFCAPTGTYESLYQFELDQSVGYVFTTFDRNLVIKLYPQNLPGGAPAECRLFNVDTCQLSDPIVQVDNEEVGIFAEGNTLFLVDYENEQLRLCNMANSEWTSISYAPLCDSINSSVNKPFVFYVFDEWLRFEFWDSENYATQACFLFNMESQEFIPFDLRMSYNENWITILQIRGDNLLVQSDWLVEQDGETVTNVNAQFAFISKNDFLNSRPVYQLISSQW